MSPALPQDFLITLDSLAKGLDLEHHQELVEAQQLKLKLLDKITEKISGIDPDSFSDPIGIALSPYMTDLMGNIGLVIEALQSPLTYDESIGKLVADDPSFKPLNNFPKVESLLSGVFYSEFILSQSREYELGVIFIPHFHGKNKFPPSFQEKIKRYSKEQRFNPRITPSKFRWRRKIKD